MDALTLLYLLGLFVFIPAGAFVAYMAHRERLRDEAEDANRAGGTAGE